VRRFELAQPLLAHFARTSSIAAAFSPGSGSGSQGVSLDHDTVLVRPGAPASFRRTGVLWWSIAVCFLAAAVLLTPARVDPYLPDKASRLAPLILAGIQLVRVFLVSGALLALVTDALRRLWPPDADTVIGSAWEKRDALAAVVLIGLALCLRLPNATESFWWDELASQVRVVQRGLGVIFAFSADGNNHIANSVLMWVASRFGTEEWILRLPSLLIGTLMPAAIYLLFQRIGQRRVGLIAAALVAVHFRMVDFSNEARGYIGTAAFGAVASIAFAGLCTGWNRRWALLYVIAATAAAAFVITGAFLILAHVALAGGLLLYHRTRARGDSFRGVGAREWRVPLWCGLAACWALLLALLISALTLPQVADYSRHRAASLHSPIGFRFYRDALPYLAGVEHDTTAALLLCLALVGYWRARRNWIMVAAIVGPVLVQIAYLHLTRSVASPRMFISAVFPALIGLSLWIESQWSRGTPLRRAAALLVATVLVADSSPVFARYYFVGNPKLHELSERLPSGDVFLADAQAGINVYYFPRASWDDTESGAVRRLAGMGSSAPRFVVWGQNCRRSISPGIEQLGYRRSARLEDWTYAEHAENQRRPCFTLYERSVADRVD
jgi:hypothetical protein